MPRASPAASNHLLRMTLLAPDIVEAILDGLQLGMALEELTRAMPSGWQEQGQRLFAK